MAFEPIRDTRGQPRIRSICDDCGRDEVVCADHAKGDGQAVQKLQKMGWSYVSKRLRCPACEAKRKVVHMSETKARKSAPAATEAPREPTKMQKRQIMELLGEVYDTEQERYRRGDTDETVADVLDVMPGWVEQIREEFFGGAGSNEDMAALADKIAKLDGAIAGALHDHEAVSKRLGAMRDELKAIKSKLEKVETAVGPRVLARGGRV